MDTVKEEINDLSRIGLDKEKSEELADKLNNLLANYSLFYQNVRGYHWNIQGDKFFELHEKFEESNRNSEIRNNYNLLLIHSLRYT